MRLFAAATALALFLGVPAHAADFTAADLYTACNDADPSTVHNVVCQAYVHGILDGMQFGSVIHEVGRGYCPPQTGVSVTQGRLVIQKYMREHPEVLDRQAGLIAGAALVITFPCKS